MKAQYVKFLNLEGCACHGGAWTYPLPVGRKPRAWTPPVKAPELCHRGYHLIPVGTGTFEFMTNYPYLAEGRGESTGDGEKITFESVRLLRKLKWGRRESVLFAALCAWHVLPAWYAKCPDDDRPLDAIVAAIISAIHDTPETRSPAAPAP